MLGKVQAGHSQNCAREHPKDKAEQAGSGENSHSLYRYPSSCFWGPYNLVRSWYWTHSRLTTEIKTCGKSRTC